MAVLKMTYGLELFETDIKVFGNTDWNEQQVTTQGIMKMLACYE
jgi:hypothetical protein